MLRAVSFSAFLAVANFALGDMVPAVSEVKFVRETRDQRLTLKLSGTALQQDQQWLEFVTSSLEYLNQPQRLTIDGTILDVAYKDQQALLMYMTTYEKNLKPAGLRRNNVLSIPNISPDDVAAIRKGDRVRIELTTSFVNTTDGTNPRGRTLYFVDFTARGGRPFTGRYILQEFVVKVRGREFSYKKESE